MPNVRSVVLETLLLAVAGLALAPLANQLSPRGLSLTRNYFGASLREAPAASSTAPGGTNNPSSSPQPNASAELKARLEAKGLSVIEGTEAEALFRDPQYEQELIVFVDARNDEHYTEGHVPGAHQFDRYYPEKYFPGVLPACLTAAKVIVYCTGGKCEDSELAALALVEAGVPAAKMSVYSGGIADWTERKLSIELGARHSGTLKSP